MGAAGVRFLPSCRLDVSAVPDELPSVAQVHIFSACDRVALLRNADVTITCLAEGHPATDPHTRRMAADIRTNDGSEAAAASLALALQGFLGGGWTVIYEAAAPPANPQLAPYYFADPNATGAHLHVQPIKGTTYP